MPLNFPVKDAQTFSENGIHLSPAGYKMVARLLEKELGWKAAKWEQGEQAGALRKAILRKNEWFFHRSRPANMAYIFGFRKGEQGRNAGEILAFDNTDPLIEIQTADGGSQCITMDHRLYVRMGGETKWQLMLHSLQVWLQAQQPLAQPLKHWSHLCKRLQQHQAQPLLLLMWQVMQPFWPLQMQLTPL